MYATKGAYIPGAAMLKVALRIEKGETIKRGGRRGFGGFVFHSIAGIFKGVASLVGRAIKAATSPVVGKALLGATIAVGVYWGLRWGVQWAAAEAFKASGYKAVVEGAAKQGTKKFLIPAFKHWLAP